MEVVEGQDLYKVSKGPHSLQRNTVPRPWVAPVNPVATLGITPPDLRLPHAVGQGAWGGSGTFCSRAWNPNPIVGKGSRDNRTAGAGEGDSTSPRTCAPNKQKQKKRRALDRKQNFWGLLGRVREFGQRVAVKSYWVMGMAENVPLS